MRLLVGMSGEDVYWKGVGVLEDPPGAVVVEQKHELVQLEGGPGAHSELIPRGEYRKREIQD